MTTDTKPTDAEIDAVLYSNWPAFWRQAILVRMGLRDAVREAIAIWGQHAHSGEPVGYLYCGGSYGDELADWEIVAEQLQCDRLNEHHGALGKEAKLPLYTTPQPLAREPLTDERLLQVIEDEAFAGEPKGDRKKWRRDERLLRAIERYCRAVERAHGITKGVQHDPD